MNDCYSITKEQKVANIMSFLALLFGEDEFIYKIMKFSPDYLIEKFERYVLSLEDESQWGIHPNLKRRVVDTYLDKWQMNLGICQQCAFERNKIFLNHPSRQSCIWKLEDYGLSYQEGDKYVSECGYSFWVDNIEDYIYCPACGGKIEEETVTINK